MNAHPASTGSHAWSMAQARPVQIQGEHSATAEAAETRGLRAMALRLIEDANKFFVMDFLEDAVAAFGGGPP